MLPLAQGATVWRDLRLPDGFGQAERRRAMVLRSEPELGTQSLSVCSLAFDLLEKVVASLAKPLSAI